MRVSQQEGQSPQSSLLSRLREMNLTPAEALLDESNQVRLQTFSAEQLAELRTFRARILEDIQRLQGGTFFPPFPGFPKLPGGGDTPPPLPMEPAKPDYSCHDPREVLRTQDPEAYAALARLPGEVQQQFLDLVRTIGFQPKPRLGGILGGMTGGLNPQEPEKPQINPDLLGLLKSGKLTKKNSEGRTLLQTLTGLSTQEMGPNLDRTTIFNELCSQLHDPGRIHQGRRNTCAPTTIQHLQASRDPAEYARIIAGLTSKEGSVRMRNGDILRRDLGSVAGDDSGRNNISRLYQAALMEYANGEKEYDNRTDVHTRPDDTTHTGLYADESERALDALFGDRYDKMSVNNRTEEGRAEAEAALRRALDAGQEVPIGMSWGTGGHALLVIGMTESTVLLRNPWGSGDRGGDGSGGNPPRVAIDSSGTIEMSKEDFFSRVNSLHLPKQGGSGNDTLHKGASSGAANGSAHG